MRYIRENVQTRVILRKDNDKKNFLASTLYLYTHNLKNNRLRSDERTFFVYTKHTFLF